jgi:hypothetical protein
MSQKDDVKWYTDQNLERVKNLIALYSGHSCSATAVRKNSILCRTAFIFTVIILA